MSTPVIAAIVWAVLLGGVGGALTEIGPWYRNLKKPSWQPPDWAFGPIWTLVLVLAAWAGVLAWNAAPDVAGRSDVAIVYAVNFVFHFLWSPLFFKLKRPDWGLIEVVFLWASVVAMIVVVRRYSDTGALMLAPYIVWVSIAAVLNRAIVRLNPGEKSGLRSA